MRFFALYQFLAPAVLFPISYYLWWQRYGHDHRLVVMALSMPVLFAYVIPGLGTNWLRLWEINTRPRLGRFRPHHGFVFGTAASLLALLCMERIADPLRPIDLVRGGFVVGSVLAFWNWWYDIHAIRTGFITVYNRPNRERRGPEAVATDYAPVLFGVFGLCYGVAIRVNEQIIGNLGRADLFWLLFAASNLTVLIAPVVAFSAYSYATHGTSGLVPFREV